MATGTITKHAGESLYLGFRYHSPALASTENVTGCTVTAQAGITAGTAIIDGNEVASLVSGGTANTTYTIRFAVSTDQGQVFIDDYTVRVIA